MPVQQYTGEMHLILSIFLLIVAVIAGSAFAIWRRRIHRESEPERRKQAAIAALLRDQAAVIDSVITEITSRPASYAGFPQDALDELMRVHREYPSVSTGRIIREDY